MGSPLFIMFWSCKIHIYLLKSVQIDILFLCKTCELLVYNMFCFQFDTNSAQIPWTTCKYELKLKKICSLPKKQCLRKFCSNFYLKFINPEKVF